MTKIDTILAKFSKHNDLLRELGYKDIKDYICPICLKHFSMKETEKLTLEDVPPKALGGKKIAITCKTCNNTCGHEIDNHLANAIAVLDAKTLTPGSVSRVTVPDRTGNQLNGTLNIGKDGFAEFIIPDKINNPKNLIERLPHKGDNLNAVDRVHPDRRKANISLLKTAYMILFSKFGYTFLLDENYNTIREQILNPDKPVLPEIVITYDIFSNDEVFAFGRGELKGFFVSFYCEYKTKKTHRFCLTLPAPTISYEEFYDKSLKLKQHTILVRPITDNYLTDINLIEAIHNWCYTV